MAEEIDYKKIREFTCPLCDWMLHVEKDVWEKFPDQHYEIVLYVQQQLDNHARTTHNVNNVNSLSKLSLYSKEDMSIDAAKDSPYIGMADETK